MRGAKIKKIIFSIIIFVIVISTITNGISIYQNMLTSSTKKFNENNIGECYFQETEKIHIAKDDVIMYADNEILVVAEENVEKKEIEELAKNIMLKL